MNRDALVRHLDDFLDVKGYKDKSLNGLQVEGASEVQIVALAVDACMASITRAAAAGAQMLIVHHGLFWGTQLPVTGMHKERLKALLDSDLSLYAAHLPLDAHAKVGNNRVMAEMLELSDIEPFGEYAGKTIGWAGNLSPEIARDELTKRIEAALGSPITLHAFGREHIRRVAVVSGGAADLAEEAANAQIDLFITGELTHVHYHLPQELSLNLASAGHYGTEVFGVKALGRHLKKKFSLETRFIDVPTGL